MLITAVVVENRPVREVAAAYGVSKSWLHELLARYRGDGDTVFQPRSRRPQTSPTAVPAEVVDLIVELREKLSATGLDAGPDTLVWHLAHHHETTVSPATVARYLAKHGLVVPEPKKSPKSSYIRFQAEQPNQTWQADFTHCRLARPDGRPGADTEILTWLDDHSRVALSVTAHHRVTGPVVLATFRETVVTHGIPGSTLTDNGMVFTTRLPGGSLNATRGRNSIEHELRRLGVTQKNSRPNHPTTCGKVERPQPARTGQPRPVQGRSGPRTRHDPADQRHPAAASDHRPEPDQTRRRAAAAAAAPATTPGVDLPRRGLPGRAGAQAHLPVLALDPAHRPASDHPLLRAHGRPAGPPARGVGLVARAAQHPDAPQPLVPVMHPAVASSLAVELDRLANLVRRGGAWPSPATGFAWWLAHRHGRTDLITRPDTGGALTNAGRLDEAPVLAAYGYLVAGDNDPDQLVVEAWSGAARRLRERDPLPGDRASFFFRPTELLGLALGADTIAGHDPEPRRWLRQTLHTGRGRLGTDTWSIALNTLAAAALGDTGGAGRLGPLAEATTVDLAAGWLLASGGSSAAAGAGLDQDAEALESGLLYRLTTTATTTTDIAEAAAVYTAAAAAIGTGLARPEYGLPAALTTITGVLRRFPAIVRELGNHHAGRPTLVDIADEYDVQDLLRGVLRGLFDDVRDEENTPSYGGVRSRMDLLLKREQIVIETKMTRASLDQRGVAQELAIDKEFYRSHPDCRTLICFVYDPAHRLTNPTALEDDLTLTDPTAPMPTIVIVAPHG